MPEDKSTPQINSAKLGIGGSIAGAIFSAGSLVVFLEGVPVLRYLFPAAILLGLVVAFALHFIKKETPGSPWLLAATEKETLMPERDHEKPKDSLLQSVLIGQAGRLAQASR